MSEAAQFQDRPQEFTEQFNVAIGSVAHYNEAYSDLNSKLARFFSILLPIEEDAPKPKVSREEQAAMEADVLRLLQGDALSSMGVRLIDSSLTEFDPKQANSLPGQLEPILDDSEKFADTLLKLSPTKEQKRRTESSVDRVLANTVRITWEAFMPGFIAEDEQRDARFVAERQIEMFKELQPILHQKGFGDIDSVQRMEQYVARYDQGLLPDYLKANSLMLIDTKRGPADWHIDYTGQGLSDRWDTIFDFLKSLKQKGSPLYHELFPAVRRDFDTLLSRILTTKWQDQHFNWSRRQALGKAMKRWEADFHDDNVLYLIERAEAEEGYEPVTYDPVADPEPSKPEPKDIPPEELWWNDEV